LEKFKAVEMKGAEAESLEDFKAAVCAMLYMAVDGTSHARCGALSPHVPCNLP
jgi:hypothetical protein